MRYMIGKGSRLLEGKLGRKGELRGRRGMEGRTKALSWIALAGAALAASLQAVPLGGGALERALLPACTAVLVLLPVRWAKGRRSSAQTASLLVALATTAGVWAWGRAGLREASFEAVQQAVQQAMQQTWLLWQRCQSGGR